MFFVCFVGSYTFRRLKKIGVMNHGHLGVFILLNALPLFCIWITEDDFAKPGSAMIRATKRTQGGRRQRLGSSNEIQQFSGNFRLPGLVRLLL